MRIRFVPIVQALFAAVSCFAWNNQGLAGCGGLFAVDMDGKTLAAKQCFVSDSLDVRGWRFAAAYGYVSHDFYLRNENESEMHSWTMSDKGSSFVGHALVGREYRHLEFEVDVYTLPFFVFTSRWHTLDSLAYAGVQFGRGTLEHEGFQWKSSMKTDYVPDVDAFFGDQLTFRRLYAGSVLWGNNLRAGLTYGNTVPDMGERQGFVFSDSSRFWETDLTYRAEFGKNRLAFVYGYVDADVHVFGLLREKDEDGEMDEKRFAYLPLGLDINLFHVAYSRIFDLSELSLRAVYMTVEVNVPWESRRFYETLAPNRSLTDSKLKMLSMAVFQRSFRIYGDVDSRIADLGLEWNASRSLGSWHLSPGVSADFFYAESEVLLYLRKEKSGMFYVKQDTDEFRYEASVSGALFGLGGRLESPGGMFFASVDVAQLVPFSMKFEKIEEEEAVLPPDDPSQIVPVDPTLPPVEPPKEVYVEEPKRSHPFMRMMRFVKSLAFRNGFAVSAGIGVKF